MGEVKVEVELENAVDRELERLGHIQADQVRRQKVRVLADSGAVMMRLPQDLVEALGLRTMGNVVVTYADERKEERPFAGLLTVRIGQREMSASGN